MSTRRILATGRLTAVLFGTVCLGGAVWLAIEAVRDKQKVEAAHTARPMDVEIDLSQASEQSVPYRHSFSRAHNEILVLDVPSQQLPADSEELERMLNGLTGILQITKANGDEVQTVPLTPQDASMFAGQIWLAGFSPMPPGDYQAKIEIHTGAAELAGIPHSIYAKYFLCGIEELPVFVIGGLSAASGLIGLVTVAIVIPRLWKQGIWKEPAVKSEPNELPN